MLKKICGNLLGYERQLHELRQQVKQARWDPVFGMHTRAGLLEIAESQPRSSRHTVVFLDLDRLHELNIKLGYEEANHRIRAAFHGIAWRKSDVLGRWFSGDEIVVLLDSDETATRHCLERLTESAAREGLSFTAARSHWTPGNQDFQELITRLSEQVLLMKRACNHAANAQPPPALTQSAHA